MNINRVILDANKLIQEYNEREENDKKLFLCDRLNISAWLSIPKMIIAEIQGTELEKIYNDKFINKTSYIKGSQESFISETTFYAKSKVIYDTAINYLYYKRLFIVKDTAMEIVTIKDNGFNLIQDKEHIYKNYEVIEQEECISGKSFLIEIENTPDQNINIFLISKNAKNIIFKNCRFEVIYKGGNSKYKLCLFNNNSQNFELRNCNISFTSCMQINFTAIYNFGGEDTHLDTQADMMNLSGCRIELNCEATEFLNESSLCGIENNFANSICVTNNYIFVKNNGNGEKQKAYGIINSGRFARIENNNIKANASHNAGKLLEQAHACAMYNTGMYMVFTGNNCVAEWGGKCVGLYNAGEYANITGNKILATHTIMGRTVILNTEHCILNNNIITNTSRNPHFVEIFAGDNIINGNYMQGLLNAGDYQSGCGIWLKGKAQQKIKRCNISSNIISCAKDFGIILQNTEKNIVQANQFIKFAEVVDYVAVYAENLEDKIFDNIYDGQLSTSDNIGYDKLFKNYDEIVRSLTD